MSSSLRDEATIADIVRAARLIAAFLAGATREGFRSDTKTQSAVQHQLLVIGEAVKRLSEAFRDAHAEIPWRLISGLRDHLVHGYDAVDLDEVWLAASRDVPRLLRQLEPLAPKGEMP